MAVIPFIQRGRDEGQGKEEPEPTVVSTREEFEDLAGLDGDVVFIQDLDRDQLDPDRQDSNVTYDLRVGDVYRDHRDAGPTQLEPGDEIELLPGAAVIVETVESVQFPKTRFGHIVPKVSLLQQGISNTSSKIDPGYEGKLLITVFNLGKQKTLLKRGQRFCSLYVLSVQAGATAYRKPRRTMGGASRTTVWRKVRDATENNSGLLAVIAIVVSAILGILEILAR